MTDNTFLFEIITPTKAFLSQQVEMVIIPGSDGNFGVLPSHSPLLSSLRPGTIEIRDRGLTILDEIFVESGFAEVVPDRCTVLAEEALYVKNISREDAEERLKRAHDALMVADTFGVRLTAERDIRAAEAMVAAIEAHGK